MKLVPKLFWETPGEKEKFGKLIEGKELYEAIITISNEFSLDITDAKSAVETYNQYIKNGKNKHN